MRVADVPAVLAIERAAFVGDPPWSEGLLRDELDLVPESRHYLVAVDAGGHVIGYGGVLLGLDEADVTTLAVAEPDRRCGVGSALLRALIGEAARRRLAAVLLEVRSSNTAARRLYEHEGFVVVARRPRYYADGGDAVVLRRLLR
jgi:ribosomal-protein-alanine N-acetyltransferase